MERLSRALVFSALIALLFEPARWLANTWIEPSYGSDGGLVALLCLGLGIRSVASGPASANDRDRRWAWILFAAAAATRLAGRLLDVDHIGALALVADVAALGLYLRLRARPWPVHPGALAGLFALSLPTEQLLQHVLGHPLRIASAAVAAGLLQPLVPGLERAGSLLSTPGATLHVDLPCSGAQGLFLFGVAAWFFACFRRVGVLGALGGTAAVLLGALVANALRLAALILGPTETLLQEPWHSVVGLIAMAIGALPVLATARALPPRIPAVAALRTAPRRVLPLPAAAALAALALGISLAPHHPVDTSAPLTEIRLPQQLLSLIGQPGALSSQEREYFGKFGGAIERRTYAWPDGSEHTALLVATSAPIRHLHGADLCLRGAGHQVTRLGIRPDPVATTVFKTIDPEGRAWRVQSTLVSAEGEVVETPSEVVWRWMSDGGAWMRVERITPWELCEADPARCDRFDRALLTSLDVNLPTPES